MDGQMGRLVEGWTNEGKEGRMNGIDGMDGG